MTGICKAMTCVTMKETISKPMTETTSMPVLTKNEADGGSATRVRMPISTVSTFPRAKRRMQTTASIGIRLGGQTTR